MKMLLLTLLAGVALTFGNPFSKKDAEKLKEEMISMKDQLTGMKDVIVVNKIVDEAEVVSSDMKANDVESLEKLLSLGEDLEASLKDMESHKVKFNAEQVKDEMDEIVQKVKNKVVTKAAKDPTESEAMIKEEKEAEKKEEDFWRDHPEGANDDVSDADEPESKVETKAKDPTESEAQIKEDLEAEKKEEEFWRDHPDKANDLSYLHAMMKDAKQAVSDAGEDIDSKRNAIQKVDGLAKDFAKALKELKDAKADIDIDQLKDEVLGLQEDLKNKFLRKDEPERVETVDVYDKLNSLADEAKKVVEGVGSDETSRLDALNELKALKEEFKAGVKDAMSKNLDINYNALLKKLEGVEDIVKGKDKEKNEVNNYLFDLAKDVKETVQDVVNDDTELSRTESLNKLKDIESEFKDVVKDASGRHIPLEVKNLYNQLKDVERDVDSAVKANDEKNAVKANDEKNKAKKEVNDYLFDLAHDAKEIVNDDSQLSQVESLNKLRDIQSEFKDVVKDASEKHIPLEYKNLQDQLKDVEKGIDSILHAKDAAEETKEETKNVETVNDSDYLLDLTEQVKTIVSDIGSDKKSFEDALHEIESLKTEFQQVIKDVKEKNIDVAYSHMKAQLKDAEQALIAKKDALAKV